MLFQETADLVTFTEEILNGKLHFLCSDKDFTIKSATVVEINKIIKHLNPKKVTGPDKIPVKIVKLATNIIDSHLKNIINNELSRNSFSNSTV